MSSYPSSPRSAGKGRALPPGQRHLSPPCSVSMAGNYYSGTPTGLMFTFTYSEPVSVSGIIPVVKGTPVAPGATLAPQDVVQSLSGSLVVTQVYPGLSGSGLYFTPSGFPNARTQMGGVSTGNTCSVAAS